MIATAEQKDESAITEHLCGSNYRNHQYDKSYYYDPQVSSILSKVLYSDEMCYVIDFGLGMKYIYLQNGTYFKIKIVLG